VVVRARVARNVDGMDHDLLLELRVVPFGTVLD
jgi:hypothetical protein